MANENSNDRTCKWCGTNSNNWESTYFKGKRYHKECAEFVNGKFNEANPNDGQEGFESEQA